MCNYSGWPHIAAATWPSIFFIFFKFRLSWSFLS